MQILPWQKITPCIPHRIYIRLQHVLNDACTCFVYPLVWGWNVMDIANLVPKRPFDTFHNLFVNLTRLMLGITLGRPWSIYTWSQNNVAICSAILCVVVGIQWVILDNLFTYIKMASKPWVEGVKPKIKSMLITSQFFSRTSKGYNKHVGFKIWALLYWKISQDYIQLLTYPSISSHQTFTCTLFQVLVTPTLYIASRCS